MFLEEGRLEHDVLPLDFERRAANMNGAGYNTLETKKFDIWRRRCFRGREKARLAQDHERRLWQDRNRQALKKAGLTLLLLCEAARGHERPPAAGRRGFEPGQSDQVHLPLGVAKRFCLWFQSLR